MKKMTAIILSVLVIVSVMCNAFAAAATNRVYAEPITVEAGERVTVPIKIENNDGFMGFSVNITYDADVFTPVSVSKGAMLSGMFNDSIATSTNNTFKVVFTGTEDIVSDGVIINAVFDVSDSVSGSYDIELSYSQQDTFKENWENVKFNCESAEVVVTLNGTTRYMPTTARPTTTTTTTVFVTDDEGATIKPDATTAMPDNDATTAMPDNDATTAMPDNEPTTDHIDGPAVEKPLSVRMREWVDGLAKPFNVFMSIFVYPLAFVISLFE